MSWRGDKTELLHGTLRVILAPVFYDLAVGDVEDGHSRGCDIHHFQSKKGFYGALRDDMTQRVLDRMEAVAEAVVPERAVKSALLAAYDGVLRIRVGRLLTEPDPRGSDDAIAGLLGELAAKSGMVVPDMLGVVLAAALRAALAQALEGHAEAREALELLLG